MRSLGLVLAVALMAGSAHAQTLSDEQRQEVRTLFEQAGVSYSAGDFERALDLYGQAYELRQVSQLLFNMGRCLKQLGRFVEAVSRFERALEMGGLSEAESQMLQQELTVARAGVARLSFSMEDPQEAEREVELGELRCSAPCELLVDPGTRTYTFAGERTTIEVLAGDQRTITLRRLAAAPVERLAAERRTYRPGWAMAVGLSLAAIGGAGAVGFGLQTRNLRDDFNARPRATTADDGERARLLTNLSIGIAAAGATMWLVDILVQKLRAPEPDVGPGEARAQAW